MELNDSSRAPGSSHPAIPRSVFPGSLGKTLAFTTRCPSPHSHQPTAPTSQRCRIADTAADNDPRAATAPVSKPAVFLVEPWTIQPVQTHRQHLLPILPTLPISSALPIPTPPVVPEPALFCQRVPSTTFPAWPGRSDVQPMFVQQSALPISPPVGMAAAAPMSRPAVFSVKPWTVQSRDPGNAAGSRPSLRDAVPLDGLRGTNQSDMGLNLSGSWQQGHSATYNTPSRI